MNYKIRSLRAFAAIAVLFFHAIPFYARAGGTLGFARSLLVNGYAGVDLFFVLSRFNIAKSFRTRIQDFTAVGRFPAKRAYRIFLGYWPLLLLVALFYLWLMPHRLEQVSGIKSFFLLSNRIPDLVIGQSWSLSHELFFFLAFGIQTLIDRVTSNMLAMAYSAEIVVANVADPDVAKGFFLNPHFLELFAGMFLGRSSMPRLGPGKIAAARACRGAFVDPSGRSCNPCTIDAGRGSGRRGVCLGGFSRCAPECG